MPTKEASAVLEAPISDPLASKPHTTVPASELLFPKTGQVTNTLMLVWAKRHIEGGDTITTYIDKSNKEAPLYVFEADDMTAIIRMEMLIDDVKKYGWPAECRGDAYARV
jgi:hypothetical protein